MEPRWAPRRHRTLSALPGTVGGLPQRASDHQVVVGQGDQQARALKLLWGAYMGRRPEQLLFEEAVAMLLFRDFV